MIELNTGKPTPPSPEFALEDCLRRMDAIKEDEKSLTPDTLYKKFHDSLNKAGGPGLLIIDDASPRSPWEKLIPPPGWKTIVTSRYVLEKLPLFKVEPTPFEMLLDCAIGYNLLRGREITRLQMLRAAELCHGNPKLFPIVVRRMVKVVDDYNNPEKEDRVDIEKYLENFSVTSDFQMAVSILLDSTLSSLSIEARDLLFSISILTGTFTPDHLVFFGDPEGAAREELETACLIDIAPKAEGATGLRFKCHDLVSNYAVSLLSPESREKRELQLVDWLLAKLRKWDALYKKNFKEGLKPFHDEVHHVNAVLKCLRNGKSDEHRSRLAKLTTLGSYLIPLRFPPVDQCSFLKLAIREAKASKQIVKESIGHSSLGWAHLAAARTETSREEYTQALRVLEQWMRQKPKPRMTDEEKALYPLALTRGYHGLAFALMNLGYAAQALGELEKASREAEQLDEVDRRRLLRNIHRVRGLAFLDLGKIDEAHEQFTKGSKLCDSEVDPIGVVIHQNGFGLVALARGDAVTGEKHFRKALIDCEKGGWAEEETRGRLALALLRQSRHDEAITEAWKAAEIAERIKEWRGYACSHLVIGLIFQSLSRRSEALETWKEGLRWAKECKDLRLQARLSVLLARKGLNHQGIGGVDPADPLADVACL